MSLKGYPQFSGIELEDKEFLEKALKENPPQISEFTFTNLYAWRDAEKLTASILNGLIILRAEFNKQKCFFYPIGNNKDIKPAIEIILKDYGTSIIRAPKEIASLFENNKEYTISADADNADYLYKTKDLIQLEGRKYDGKRNLLKNFKSNNQYQYLKYNQSNFGEYLNFEKHWCNLKDCDNVEGLKNERQAIREMLTNFSSFKLTGATIKIKDEIRAICLGQALNSNTMVIHVLKADHLINGLYQTMLNEFLFNEGKSFEYINMEQDLGIAGLRKSKQSYHPIAMVEKYTLTIMASGNV